MLGGCAAYPLMPTPNIYAGESGYPENQVPEALKSNHVDLLYVTDRSPEIDTNGDLSYRKKCSDSIAFGSAMIEIGDKISWQELVRASQSRDRDETLEVAIRSRTELGRFPATPHPFSVRDGLFIEDREVVDDQNRVEAAFRTELNRRLAVTSHKEVVIYVHGFNNSFDFAASAHAEIWHFLGRRGVPILYSWPAAHGGLLAYFVDRESGEFTIYPLPRACRGPGRRPGAACSADPPRATARLRIPATRRGHRRADGGRSRHLR